MRSTHLKVCSLSWPPYCQFWQGLQGPKDPANDHNQVLILSENRFCSHNSRNFRHFLFNFTYVVFPREGLGGGYWGPGCCQIDHLCFFFTISATVVKVLTKHWKSELVAEVIMMCAWRGSLHWQFNSTPLLFLPCALQFRCSKWCYQCLIETVNQALLCMM